MSSRMAAHRRNQLFNICDWGVLPDPVTQIEDMGSVGKCLENPVNCLV